MPADVGDSPPAAPTPLVRLLLAGAVVGVLAGLAGVLLTWLLHLVQHTAFGYTEDAFLLGVERASRWRRVVALGVGGALVAAGWYAHRRVVRSNVSVTHALTTEEPLRLAPTTSDAVLQIVAVGAGASLGREGAPRQVGAALTERLAERLRLDRADRVLLVAAGAGGGLAAVYDVPVAGALFTLEVLLTRWRPRAAAVAAVASVVAALVARVALGGAPVYVVPPIRLDGGLLAVAALGGVLAAPGALAFRAVMTHARATAPSGLRGALAIVAAFLLLGVVAAVGYPEVLGNGKGLAQIDFEGTGRTGLGLALTLLLLKPASTFVALRAGAIGGLLTPAFSTGATLGLLSALLLDRVGAGAGQPAATALVVAAAFLAVAQRMPLTAVVLALELTHADLTVIAPVAIAVATAAVTARGAAGLRRPVPGGPARD